MWLNFAEMNSNYEWTVKHRRNKWFLLHVQMENVLHKRKQPTVDLSCTGLETGGEKLNDKGQKTWEKLHKFFMGRCHASELGSATDNYHEAIKFKKKLYWINATKYVAVTKVPWQLNSMMMILQLNPMCLAFNESCDEDFCWVFLAVWKLDILLLLSVHVQQKSRKQQLTSRTQPAISRGTKNKNRKNMKGKSLVVTADMSNQDQALHAEGLLIGEQRRLHGDAWY